MQEHRSERISKRRQRRSHSVAGKPATWEVSFNRCTSPGDRPDGSTKQTGSAGSPPRAFHNKTDTTVSLQNNALKYDTLIIKTRLCPDKMSLTSCCLAVSCAALLARIPGGGSEWFPGLWTLITWAARTAVRWCGAESERMFPFSVARSLPVCRNWTTAAGLFVDGGEIVSELGQRVRGVSAALSSK